MDQAIAQRRLSTEQVEAFYHQDFVGDQVRDFGELMGDVRHEGVVADVGGGCGFFAGDVVSDQGVRVRVIDMDPGSVQAARDAGIEAVEGDALAPQIQGDESVACFNLILHHLIAGSERETRALQIKAIRAWHGRAKSVFVNEYIYQSFVGTVSGALIYAVTVNPILSGIAKQAARVIPAFRANTFGVGVRFRSHEEWLSLFEEAGYRVTDTRIGAPEPISWPLRSLLIRTIRRDSFRLEPVPNAG
jgi:ribosomal protein L11 methylase PrmA